MKWKIENQTPKAIEPSVGSFKTIHTIVKPIAILTKKENENTVVKQIGDKSVDIVTDITKYSKDNQELILQNRLT